VLEEERQLPERWFRQEWLVDFLSSEGAVSRDVRARIAAPPPDPKHPVTVGVDLAKRTDFSVFAAFDAGGRMVAFDRMQGIPYPQQSQRLCAFAGEVGATRVLIETNGPGEAFVDMFRADAYEVGLGCKIEGLQTTATSKGQMINALAVAFEKPGGITLLDDPVLLNEFEAFSASQLPSGSERFGAPEGEHDDCVMACALALSQLVQKPARPPGTIPLPGYDLRLRKEPYGGELYRDFIGRGRGRVSGPRQVHMIRRR